MKLLLLTAAVLMTFAPSAQALTFRVEPRHVTRWESPVAYDTVTIKRVRIGHSRPRERSPSSCREDYFTRRVTVRMSICPPDRQAPMRIRVANRIRRPITVRIDYKYIRFITSDLR